MSVEEKFMSKLDEIAAGIADYQKSSAAERLANKTGVETLKADLEAVRKQLQEFAEIAKRGVPDAEATAARSLGELVVRSFRGIHKAASEGTDADGGFVVEDETVKSIRAVQNQYGLVRRVFGTDIIPMKSDVLRVPTDTFEDDTAANNTPEPVEVAENAQIAESNDAQLALITLTAQKHATLNYISQELMDDSFVDFLGAYLIPKLGRRAARIEDGVVFTAATTGLMNSASVPSVDMDTGDTTFQDVSFELLSQLEDEVVDDGLAEGTFYAHRSIYGILKRLKGSDGQFLWSPAAAGEPATILGWPMERGSRLPTRAQSAVSTGFVLFGDARLAAVVGERLTRRIDTSKDFRFDFDQIAVRMIFRFAFGTNAHIGRALARLVTAAA